MRIARAHEFGGPDKVVIDEIDAPSPGAGQLRIGVKAAGVNPVDWKLLSGKSPVLPPLPLTPGGDIAGFVEAVGEGVDSWSVGDRAFAHPGLTGGFAESVVLDAAAVAPFAEAVSFAAAAALPLVALTGWQAFVADGRDLAGLHVLVHNGAGGVGSMAIQIAKARGARVTASASEANERFVREQGADVVIDFRAAPVARLACDVDVLLDLVGNSREIGLWALVRRGGSVQRIAGGVDAPAKVTIDGVRAYKVRVRPNGAQLREIASLTEQGRLRPHIEQCFALGEVQQALRASMGGHVRGKIVLTIG